MNNRALRVEPRDFALSSGIRSVGIIIDICARKYVYVLDVFRKTSKRASTLSNFYNVLSFFMFLFSRSCVPLFFFFLHLSPSVSATCNCYRAHSTTYLSIIFTVEGILVGAQLRRIDG